MSLSTANIRRRVSVVKRKLSAFPATVIVVVFLTTLGAAQTQRQLEEKYPKVNAYLVRPNILLTARYSADGLVCEMALQPVRWTGDTVLLFPLSEEETIRVVEEIVPESERGKRLGGLLGTDDKVSSFHGHSFTTPYTYEKITVNFAGTTKKVVPTWWPWSLGATVHANDWRNIPISLIDFGSAKFSVSEIACFRQ
jgi:hypothetical protein